jgi:pantoate--beta-alanine ligase
MKIIRSSKALRKALEPLRARGKTVGFVPTMGFLHEGHLRLMRVAKKECGIIVVSLFVNPLQFGPKEDLKKYPRNETRDSRVCRLEKVDFLFIPKTEDLYNPDFQTTVSLERLSEPLCGRFRPGHFRGVVTVVAKLFNIVQPGVAYFGRKDYQQARLMEQMTKDLSYDIRIRILPTVREKDGLAMSSRNVYLKPEERVRAAKIYQALRKTDKEFRKGEKSARRLKGILNRALRTFVRPKDIDYAEVRDAVTLEEISRVKSRAVAAIAVRIGKTRLIDNVMLG